jgi:Uma2 family endonuclease
VPDLIIEVLSPFTSSVDRGEKKAIYQANGVREYWIVSVTRGRTARFNLGAKGRFGKPKEFGIDDTFTSKVLPGLRFVVRDIVPRP